MFTRPTEVPHPNHSRHLSAVINLGTNDYLWARPELVETYNATYVDLVSAADQAYGPGTVHFFLACGPMDDTYCANVDWIIEEVTSKGIVATLLDQTPFLNGTYGEACCGHPSEAILKVMAESAVAFIKGAMGW